jgi:hypothetical protein
MLKRVNKSAILLSITYFLIPYASAYTSGEQLLNKFADGLNPLLGFIVGDINNGELLVIKSLVFIILVAIINFSLNRGGFFDKRINAILGIIISLIAVRYITSEQLVNFIWLPYGTLGVFISSILPFLIFFFFIESFDSNIIRRVGWISYMAIYFMLGYLRFNDFSIGQEWWQNLAWVYVFVGVLSFLILLFENRIRASMMVSAIRKGYDAQGIILRNELDRELRKINDALANPNLSSRDISKLKEERKRIETAIRRIH